MRDLHRSKTGVRREAELSWAAPSAFGFAGRAARAGLRRIARPLTWRQQIVDATLAGGLSELERLAALDALAADAHVSDGVVMAETDVGRLLLHVEDKVMTPLIQRDHLWEAPEGRFLRSVIHPGAVVVDVGANVGYMTLLAARAAGPEGLVIAVEPERANAGLLRANVWLNGFANVRVIPVAAWSRRELLPLRFNTENRGDHQVGADAGGENRPSPLVPAAPLDELLGELVVDVVKVDTQGTDHEAIAGLSATLSRSPNAVVLTEFWLEGLETRGLAPAEVLRRYRDWGFNIALLHESGAAHPASDDQVIAGCQAWEGRFVNLVLRRGATA